MRLCVISTKTSLSPLLSAIEEISSKHGDIIKLVGLYYTHELDENAKLIERLLESLKIANVVLLDIRTPTSGFVKLLNEALRENDRIVVPLVGGSSSIIRMLRLGKLKGSKIPSMELDFDVQHLDMSRVWRIQEFLKKMGKIIPIGSLKDARNWVLMTTYWSYGDKENLKNMLLLLLKEYFKFKVSYQEPIERVKPGSIYHPRLGFIDASNLLKGISGKRHSIALFLYSGMHFEQCKPVADALFNLLEREGVAVIPIIGGSSKDLDKNPDLIRNALSGLKVDALVNLHWFRLRGGPYGGDPKPTLRLLRELNCLLINGLIMFMREVDKWEANPQGLSPIEVITSVALPEADGALEPIPLAGLTSNERKDVIVIENRIKKRVARLLKWLELKKKPVNERKIAIIIYNYPPGEHNIGSASYLDVFKSLEVLLEALAREGYHVKTLSAEELRKHLIEKGLLNSPFYRGQSCEIKVPYEEYVNFLKSLPEKVRSEIVKAWGSPPGNINVNNVGLLIPGLTLGNVFIGVQPSRGVHEELDKIYHSKDLPPHHQYLAFYYWINEVFKADAIIHLGTHGTLEFMPGKEVGLSNMCYPDILIGDVPHIYLYHVTNPSEMTIAKRRSYAYTITHLTPPYTTSGLYEDYIELEELIHEYSEAKVQDPERAKIVEKLVIEKAGQLNMNIQSVEEAHVKIYEMKRSVIPSGLHVLGRKWSREELIEYITLLLRRDGDVKSLHRLLAEARGLNYDDLLDRPSSIIAGKLASKVLEELELEAKELIKAIVEGNSKAILKQFPNRVKEDVEAIVKYVRELASRIENCNEVKAVIRALNGEYLEPRVAGDPLRTPDALPTGSHGYAFDPRLIPSKAAYMRGIKIAEETLTKHYEKYKSYPQTVAVVLWGFETMGTRGETIGQILQYLGVRLVRKHGPWSWDLEVIPLEELRRPRIDVLVTICGIFRDTFPNLITLLDRAFKLVANLDEPEDMNYVKKHVREAREKGVNWDLATARVFGPKNGAYNTRLTEMIESSNWRSEEDLAKTYMEDMMYAYTEKSHSIEAGQTFKALIKTVDLVTQVRYANEYEITDLDHYYEFLGGLKKTVEQVKDKRVEALWIDTTLEKPKVKSIEEAVDNAVRARLLNPKWIDSMLKHGYDGAREIAKRVEYVLGLAATTNAVEEWIWRKLYEKYLLNTEIRERMAQANPYAVLEIVKRIYEAYERGYWKPSEDEIKIMRKLSAEMEALAEG